jgi:hypothetical protein
MKAKVLRSMVAIVNASGSWPLSSERFGRPSLRATERNAQDFRRLEIR